MNDWMCARSAATRSAARTCCMRALGADADEFVEAAGGDGDACRGRGRRSPRTARSSSPRSCETSSAAPGKRASQVSSHSVASRSRWLVGSSSSSRSGAANSAVASATRMRQPPENSSTGRGLGGLVEAQAGEDGGGAGRGAHRRRSRAGVRGSRPGGGRRAVSASASRARRSGSPCSTVSSSVASPEGASCATVRDAGAGGEADVAAVQRHLAGDGAQQRGFAGAVAADQADAAALVHGEVGTVQDGAPAKADGGAGDDEERTWRRRDRDGLGVGVKRPRAIG